MTTFKFCCIKIKSFNVPVLNFHDISVRMFLSAIAIINGVICGPVSLVSSMVDVLQGSLMLLGLGPTMNPKIAFEISVRLPHLCLRMKEHGHRALIYATRMEKLGLKVIYPGHEDHSQHAS